MKGVFAPHFSILPAAQRRLWPALGQAAELGCVLYGGTAIALRLGHRASIDFDFFSGTSLPRSALAEALPFTRHATVLQDERDALTFLVNDEGAGAVKLSFFALPDFGRIGEPEKTDDGVLVVASFADLLATKLKVILQRAEAKDYRDIAALLRAKTDLAHGLAGARTLFGPNFQPSEALKALVYFDDGDLATLNAADRQILVQSARNVRDLPDVPLAGPRPS
jgi:hypothetical protein